MKKIKHTINVNKTENTHSCYPRRPSSPFELLRSKALIPVRNQRKKKDGRPLLSKANKLKTYAKQLEARDPLITKEHLLDLGNEKYLINQLLKDREDEG